MEWNENLNKSLSKLSDLQKHHCENECSREATCFCNQCETKYCETCFVEVHKPPAMRKHLKLNTPTNPDGSDRILSRSADSGIKVHHVGVLKDDEKEGVLQKSEVIGNGSFGRVYKGQYLGQTVAVKEIIGGACLQKDFFHELAMLKKLGPGHTNVVKLLAYSDSPPDVYMVFEYVKGGSVNDKLLHLTKTSLPLVFNVLRDVAKGMSYLHSCNIVHRDLASRNVLFEYDEVNRSYIFKVCDFGYARLDMLVTNKTKTRMLPIKWSSPEGLKMSYGKPGDVWSFANLAIELLLGVDDPFPKVTDQIKCGQLGKRIRDHGEHPDRPKTCPDSLWNLLLTCWKYDPALRAKFDQLSQQIHNMESTLSDEERSEHHHNTNHKPSSPYQKMYLSSSGGPSDNYCDLISPTSTTKNNYDTQSDDSGDDSSDSEQHQEDIKSQSQTQTQKKILLVEDNPVNQKVIMKILTTEKHECDLAINGTEGVDKATRKGSEYDLILMDIMMSDIDGIEATKMIRKWERQEGGLIDETMKWGIPIIAVSTRASLTTSAMAAGMNDYVLKPIDKSNLLAKIAQWTR